MEGKDRGQYKSDKGVEGRGEMIRVSEVVGRGQKKGKKGRRRWKGTEESRRGMAAERRGG